MSESFVVTGGSGFIGSALCDYLCKTYPNILIINVSKQTYATSPKLTKFLEEYKNYKFVPMDFNDTIHFYELLKLYHVSRVYHLGAETHVDRAFIYPQDFLQANVHGTFSILEAIRMIKGKKPKLFYMGTDEVFGDVKEGYKREDEVLHPENPYVASKVAAEAYCITWIHCFKVPVVIGRSMNVFGPRQNPEKLIAKIITHCIKNEPYTLYKGNSLRGWTYVYDTAEAIDRIMIQGKIGEVYHIPPVAFKTVEEVNQTILDILDTKFHVTWTSPKKRNLFKGFKDKRFKDDFRYALDSSKMQYGLGWTPSISWEKGITETINWYITHEELWK